jgi:phosphate:Na+ symporter
MDIKLLSYVFIGIGGLGSVLVSEEGRWKNYFSMLVGFGLIFLGLEGMKESFGVFSQNLDLSSYLYSSPYFYALIGLVITAIIQSSSAAIAIVQSAIFAHMISFEAAAAYVIGANVGTTVTAILGAIGGIPDKKRTAVAHLIFNLSSALVALLTLPWLILFVRNVFPNVDDVVQIALFHTLFNVLGVALWYPFISLLAKGVKKLFKKETICVTDYIHNVSTDVPELAVDALEKEMGHLNDKIEEFALLAINIPPPKAYEQSTSIDKLLDQYDENFDILYTKLYEKIRLLEGEVYRYISALSGKTVNENHQKKINTLLRQLTYLTTAAKAIKDILDDLNMLYDASSSEEISFYRNIRYQILKSVLAYHQARKGDSTFIEEMESTYKKIADSYSNSMHLIENIARNPKINSAMTAITINDMHLVKSFSKSLRNVLAVNLENSEDQNAI